MREQTSSQTVGPFFHYGLFHGGENILVNDLTRGERILITGHVFDGDGQPLPDALIETWQADAFGFFNHPNDPNCARADQHFRGFGRADSLNDGIYFFRTIKPGAVMGHASEMQAPHVNVRVFARGMLLHLDTRLYFADEPANANDALLNSIDATRRHTLIATRVKATRVQAESVAPTYRFDIHLQGDDETVFFEL